MPIRPAIPADVPAILALIRELAHYEHLTHACSATEDLLRTHLFGTTPAAHALVATPPDSPPVSPQIVGYAIYFTTFSTFLARPGLYLEDLYVQPAHRKTGLGKAFLIELARIAAANHYGRIEWSVLNWNTPSIHFYQSLGATPLEDWTMYRLTGDALAALAKAPTPHLKP